MLKHNDNFKRLCGHKPTEPSVFTHKLEKSREKKRKNDFFSSNFSILSFSMTGFPCFPGCVGTQLSALSGCTDQAVSDVKNTPGQCQCNWDQKKEKEKILPKHEFHHLPTRCHTLTM